MVQCDLKSLKLPSGEAISAAFRAAREKYLLEGSIRLKQTVQSEIRSSGMTIRSGNVISWQALFRERGYAAVRPEASARGANSPGAITNYLESGHRIRPPSGRAARYTPRIRKAYVGGFGFYAQAQQAAQTLAQDLAQKVSETVVQTIERSRSL